MESTFNKNLKINYKYYEAWIGNKIKPMSSAAGNQWIHSKGNNNENIQKRDSNHIQMWVSSMEQTPTNKHKNSQREITQNHSIVKRKEYYK